MQLKVYQVKQKTKEIDEKHFQIIFIKGNKKN